MIEKIIVHCSATPPDMDIDVSTIRDWHVNGNGWSDIGYQYVITRSGEIQKGRDTDRDGDVEDEIGAHTKGFNKNSIGICLVGGVDSNNNAESNFTFNQYLSLDILIDEILSRHPDASLYGHRDLDNSKECPSFNVVAWRNK